MTRGREEAGQKKIRLPDRQGKGLAKANGELKKLKLMSPMWPKPPSCRWHRDADRPALAQEDAHQEDLLERRRCSWDHFGLERVKGRILRYLAVQARSAN